MNVVVMARMAAVDCLVTNLFTYSHSLRDLIGNRPTSQVLGFPGQTWVLSKIGKASTWLENTSFSAL